MSLLEALARVPSSCRAYAATCMRHLAEWLEGQNVGAKSGLHPLAHALACIAIILDAEAAGTLIDDRNYPGGYSALVSD